MALIDKISEAVIKVPLVSTTKHEVLQELLDILIEAGKVKNRQVAYDALLERESRGSTGLEKGIAVPHTKTNAVDELTIAIGLAPQGIEFDAADGQPSKLFFLLLAAPTQAGTHLEALSEIARMSKSDAFLRTLLSARSPQEMIELFRD
jgi:nitrogen PTS system EIIA component